MGKDNGKAKASEKKVGRTAQDEGFKFGAVDLAERMGITPTQLRIKLRNSGAKKPGSTWGWNSVGEMKEMQEKLEAGGRKSSKKDKPAGKRAKVEETETKAAKKATSEKRPTAEKKSVKTGKPQRREEVQEPEGVAA